MIIVDIITHQASLFYVIIQTTVSSVWLHSHLEIYEDREVALCQITILSFHMLKAL